MILGSLAQKGTPAVRLSQRRTVDETTGRVINRLPRRLLRKP